jgi:PEGA domain
MTPVAGVGVKIPAKTSIPGGILVAVESGAASCLLKGAFVRSKKYILLLVLAGVVVLSALRPATAEAQFRRRPIVVVHSGFYYDPLFYDPWFGFGYQYGYPPPYPYPPYGYRRWDMSASVRLQVTPKEAEVYVDGFYAGVVDDFDGVFQRLHVPPGDHEITFYREGYRTGRQKVYLAERSDQKLHYSMIPLPAGSANEARPVAPPTPPQGNEGGEPGAYPPPRRMPPPRMPPPDRMAPEPPPQAPSRSGENGNTGTLSIRVQPAGAEVFIDGERWRGPATAERLIVQVSDGVHRVEVQKDGYQKYTAEVEVRRGQTTPVNVSLMNRE